MKRFVLLAAFLATPPLSAEVESDIPLGLEAVTGVRSAYVFRGFQLADTLVDLQLEGEIAFSDQLRLNLGGWYATESGSGDFEELAGFVGLRQDVNDLVTVGASATYHNYRQTFFESGFDLGAFLSLQATEDLDFTFGAYHDFGAEGWYAKAQSSWSARLGEDAYLGLMGGISWIDGYYGRSGLNDFYGRASLTYNINSTVSLTPFLGWSLEIEDDYGDGDEFFGGLWFEVVF